MTVVTAGDIIQLTGYLVTEEAYDWNGKTFVVGPCCAPEPIEFYTADSFELSPREYHALAMSGQL